MPLVPLATAASAGARVVSLGYATWSNGVLRSVEPIEFAEADRAVSEMAERLGLEIEVRSESGARLRDGTRVEVAERSWRVRTDRGHLAVVTIRRLGSEMTAIRISVGLFGDESAARLMLDQARIAMGRRSADGG